jgi:hypothetical protein
LYFDTNSTIRASYGEEGYPAPQQHFSVEGSVRNGGSGR